MKNAGLLAVVIVVLTTITICCSGCASMRALWPGGVTAQDAEWVGVVSGPLVPATSLLVSSTSPKVPTDLLGILLSISGHEDPLGALLPVTLVGETQPRWVLCSGGKMLMTCRNFQINQTVHFAGSAIGPGLLWKPDMLK